MRGFSSLLAHELEGYAFGILFIGALIGIVTGVGTLQVQESAKTVIDLFAISIIILFGFLYRMWTIGQPRKTHTYFMHVFNPVSSAKGGELNAWEIQGDVKSIKTFSQEDPLFKPIVKDYKLENFFIYGVTFSDVVVIGHNDFSFTSQIMFSDVEIGQLYKPIPHEKLHKGFAAPANGAFLSVDVLSVHKVEKVKGFTGEEYVPVFLVRKGHYHSDPDRRNHPLARVEEGMKEAGAMLAEAFTVVNIQEKLIQREEKAREEGIHIGRLQGTAAVRRYKRGVDEGTFSVGNMKNHSKALGILSVIAGLTFLVGYFTGWIRL